MSGSHRNGFVAFIVLILRGVNLLRVLILNLVFFALLFLVLGLFSPPDHPDIRDGTVLVLEPQGQLVEQYSVPPLERAMARWTGKPIGEVRVRDLVGAIEHARRDPRIKRILLLPGELRAGGFAALREVGAALDRFRASGKPVDAWAVSMDRGQYYLAAHADRVYLDPMGSLFISGLSSYRLYYKDLLDKLGVNVHLFRVGTYKSAPEPWVLDHASAAAKQADNYWMNGLWQQWLDEVAAERQLKPAALGNALGDMPQALASSDDDMAKLALDDHLVDALATRHQLVRMLRKAGVPADDNGYGVRAVDMHGYLAAVGRKVSADRDHVAVIVAEGEIFDGRRPPGSIGGSSTAQMLYRARIDKHVKAVVLRVNSPGGETYAAERIRRQVELLRAAGKPVVVSMGDVAASGGYWISMNANRIFAEPNTITGSIGIFGLFYNAPDLLKKVGVQSDGVAVGPLAGAGDVTRPMDPQLAMLMQAMIDRGYRHFVGNVAKARGKDFQQIDAIAQGRVWTGRQAFQRGLVDQLGGLRAAELYAAKSAGMGTHAAVRYMKPVPVSSLQRVVTDFSNSSVARVMANMGLSPPPRMLEAIRRRLPEWHLLQSAAPGRLNVYADCLCAPR